MTPRKIRFAWLAIAACVLALPTAALAGWFAELDDAQPVTLGEVMSNPEDFVDVDVRVKVYFHSTADDYNPFYTRFIRGVYGNFKAWPINARLHTRRDWKRPYPFFYVDRQASRKLWDEIESLDPVTPIEVVGRVRDVFKGQPYFEIGEIEEIDSGHELDEVRAMIKGNAYAMRGQWKNALKQYHDAARTDLEPALVVEVYRRLADAQYHTGDYSGAVSSYHKAMEHAPKNSALMQGLEAAREMSAVRRDERKSYKPVIVPAGFEVPTLRGYKNDVDLIIEKFESSDKVAEQVAAEEAKVSSLAREARGQGEKPKASEPKQDEPAVEVVEEATEEAVEEVPAEAQAVEETEKVETPVVPVPVEEQGPIEAAAPGEESAEEGAEEAVEEVAEETVEEEPAEEEMTEEVVEEPAEEVVEEQPAEETTEEVAEEAAPAEPKADEGGMPVLPVPVPVPSGDDGHIEAAAPAEEATDETEDDAELIPVIVGADGVEEETEETVEMVEMTEPVEAEFVETTEPDDEVEFIVGPLPRLPFFGCEEVTEDDFRAILEEIARNPER